MKMNNERYNQIIDEVYDKWITEYWNNRIYPNQNDKEQFINRIKTDKEFSEKWELKIEERELSLEERYEIRCKKENIRNDWEQFYSTFGGYKNEMDSLKKSLNDNNIPTKLITITYKDEKIEVYE
jgi:hypothetical protein